LMNLREQVGYRLFYSDLRMIINREFVSIEDYIF